MTQNKRIRSFLCLILSVALLFTLCGGVTAEPVDEDYAGDEWYEEEEEEVVNLEDLEPVGYEQVAQSNGVTLYVNYETGHFYLENANTGKQWFSVPLDVEYDEISKGASIRGAVRSEMIISYVSEQEMATAEYAQEANSNADSEITISAIDDGIRVDYYFYAVGITVPVEYKLEDGLFYASVLVNDVIEDSTFMLIDINLLPAFGAGNWATDGYLFVPDGCGALVKFNNGIQLSSQYKAMIYGDDMSVVPETQVTYTETLRLPVFGTLLGNDTLMGIVTQGDGASSLTVINGHERCGYNAVSSIFHYRVMQSQYNLFNKRKVNLIAEPDFGIESYQVRYTPLDGDQADYVGMASAYREYLVEEKGLTKVDSQPKFHLETVGFFEQDATFLGIIPYTKRVALTTYEECQTILEGLKEVGISDVSVRYVGFNSNGIDNQKLPKSAKPIGVLGGSKGWQSLKAYADAEGVALMPEVDLLTFRKNGNGVSKRKSGIRSVFGKITYRARYMLSTYVTKLHTDNAALLSPEQISKATDRYLASLQKQKMDAVSLSTLGEYCYSNFYLTNQHYRSTYPQTIAAALQKYKEAGVEMTFDGGNAYVLPYASLITNVPMNSSHYDIYYKDVPFYQTVLHGYIPYTTKSIPQTADSTVAYLSAVETGTELSYIGIHEEASQLFDTEYNYLYGTTWTLWKDVAAEQYEKYMPLLKEIHNQTIVQHEEVAEKVFVTGYANGIQVAVNYNTEDVTLQGQVIPAKGFSKCEWKEVAGE